MSCCDNWDFNNINDFSSVDFATELQRNIKAWLDYAFLKIGAWEDVQNGVNNDCGTKYYNLTSVDLPVEVGYKIWAAPRKDWVWEEVSYNSGEPAEPEIYVNNVLDTGNNFEINYPLGQVRSSTITSGTITASYSFRIVQVYMEGSGEWWFKLIDSMYNGESTPSNEEVYNLLRQYGVQPPAIVLETSSSYQEGAQLGSSAHWLYQDIVFNIVTENPHLRDKIVSILTLQNDKSFTLFNSDSGVFPLNCNGTPTGAQYTDLPSWKCTRIVNVGSSSFESPTPSLYIGRVRLRFEIFNPSK
jgi:hypothetical protein